ncbi:hypothetical protein BS47DRAFT_1361088 [Hydnum rufescens UP504]|uniref:Uncharacterized protein n=1 Tax=Hydnum rufescens UP504 TaxID=1448309 RepID=A0A9P6B0E7_9AGAM|nr:hypothetical protein BS47DRAFT_1361088 [Hydnum rufescens UP504]
MAVFFVTVLETWQHYIDILGLSPKTLAEDFGDVPSGETMSTVNFSVCVVGQQSFYRSGPTQFTSYHTQDPDTCFPDYPSTFSLPLMRLSARLSESALREAIDNNNRLMQENIELKQTVEALNCRIERIPDVAKAAIIEFLSMEI